MEDREVVAAIVAGGLSGRWGLAAAYDKYAAPLYGYCRWMLREPAASEVVRHTFAVTAAELDLRDGDELRPWLYAVAREEALRRLRTDGAGFGAEAFADGFVDFADDGPDRDGDGFGRGGGVSTGVSIAERTELRGVIRAALAGLKPHEREIIELSVRHGLDDRQLSAVFGVTWSRAHALESHARERLERILAALLMARTGRQDCPDLDALLDGWDGRLTPGAADLVARHVDQCQGCAGHRHGGLRPEVLSDLLPLVPLPEELREQVLREDGTSPARRRLGLAAWGKVRGNPGKATATTAVVMWVAAAASVTLLTVTGSHAVRALVAQTHPRTSSSAPAAAGSGTAGHRQHRGARPHRATHQPSHGPGSPVPQAAPSALPSRSPSASPSHSASPSRSASASPSRSASASPSSSSPSPSPSHTPTRSPSPSPSPTSTSASPTPTST